VPSRRKRFAQVRLSRQFSQPTRGTSSEYAIERSARDRADEQARHVPWQRLLDARNQYVKMQEFYYWVRSIIEAENCIPAWLARTVDRRCPRFMVREKRGQRNRSKAPPLPVRLLFSLQEHMFAKAKRQGWFDAVHFYAIRDPRSQNAAAHWSECVKKWREVKPRKYPTFRQWLRDAARCDSSAHLVLGARKARASYRLVERARLNKAVARYMNWEAFAYWVRPLLESSTPVPAPVASQFARRCPGFLEFNQEARKADRAGFPEDWQRLMAWITDRFFLDAKKEGWIDAILLSLRSHPRAIRTMEYWERCDRIWASRLPVPYPSFQRWRQQADSYVVPAPGRKSQLAS